MNHSRAFDKAMEVLRAREEVAEATLSSELVGTDHVAYEVFPEARELEEIICSLVADVGNILSMAGISPTIMVADEYGRPAPFNLNGALHMIAAASAAAGIAAGEVIAEGLTDADVIALLDYRPDDGPDAA